MRLKLQKCSDLKFVSRIIPHKQVYNTPQLAVELFPKLALGFHTRDLRAKDRRECHLEPDWLLIYRFDENKIIFERTGTHADLFR